ncbi:MAG: hypothetical protein ABSG30_05480 [Steroidobacteraceae bacterium]
MRILLIAALAAPLLAGRPALSQILIAPNPYSEHFVQTVRQNQDAWKQLGSEVSDVVSPKLTAVEVTMSCGRYTELEASYSNGMVESKEIPGDAATQTKLGNLFALNSAIVSIVDQPCME